MMLYYGYVYKETKVNVLMRSWDNIKLDLCVVEGQKVGGVSKKRNYIDDTISKVPDRQNELYFEPVLL